MNSDSMGENSDILGAVAGWPYEIRVDFHERAGILEFVCGLSREAAERQAYKELRPKVPYREQIEIQGISAATRRGTK